MTSDGDNPRQDEPAASLSLLEHQVKTYASALEELDLLEHQLQQTFQAMYRAVRGKEGTFYIPKRHINKSFVYGHLFCSVAGEKVEFGTCGGQDNPNADHWWVYDRSRLGVRVALTISEVYHDGVSLDIDSRIGVGINSKIIIPEQNISYYGNDEPHENSLSSFLELTKHKILNDSPFRKVFVNYLTTLVAFPTLFEQGLAACSQEIKMEVDEILGQQKQQEIIPLDD